MDIPLIAILAVLGALLGSFAVAQVWRLRARQLVIDERDGEPVDKAELRRLRGLLRPVTGDRSECLHCHHQLAWYDLLPVVSWLSLSGKCRYCKAPIGTTELLAEVFLAMTRGQNSLMIDADDTPPVRLDVDGKARQRKPL